MTTTQAKPDRWTNEQWEAITSRGQNILVAAAAGSGKTSVLVERIIRRISDPVEAVHVDQLLVVTFTNAAAAEMRHRIGDALRKALEDDPASPHLRRQLALLQRASITTLHSFCLQLLQQYSYAVNLDPDFRVADEMEAELLKQDVLESKLEEWYEQEAFLELAEAVVEGQDDGALEKLLLDLHRFSMSHPDPDRWLLQAAAMFEVAGDVSLDDLPWVKPILASIHLKLLRCAGQLKQMADLAWASDGLTAYGEMLAREAEAIRLAAAACEEGWDMAKAKLQAVEFARLPAAKEADGEAKKRIQDMRNKVKKELSDLLRIYFSAETERYLEDLRRMAPLMKTLASVVLEFQEAFQLAKRERSLVDFNDLEHMALAILTERDSEGRRVPSLVARQLQEQFREVLVDEYQDINRVQETILQVVSTSPGAGREGNRFMVGDVKQSIYRFRLAEPGLFMEKYSSYPREGDPLIGKRIDLAANFRSRQEVVRAVNFLFRQIMTRGVGEIGYDPSAELIFRAEYYPDVESDALDVEVHLIEQDGPEQEEAGAWNEGENSMEEGAEDATAVSGEGEEVSVAQLEARLIANRIRQWMEPGEGGKRLLVYDTKEKALRPVEYRDIVILLRATANWAQPMMEELRAAGIPVHAEQGEGYFSTTEIELMLSLLRVIDNPLQDIPLAAVLRSPLVGLDENNLASIRLHVPQGSFHEAFFRFLREGNEETYPWLRRIRAFWERVEKWRVISRQRSLTELLTVIYRETGYAEFVACLENGAQRQANLQALYDRARQYESTSYRGLFRFLRFVDRLQQRGSDLSEARTVSESENVVRIMTIHKSKGLEFPVVFVAGLGKRFNLMDLNGSFLLHRELGFGPRVSRTDLRAKYPSLALWGIREQLRREMLAEEMRVLYVALTRAREKLILVGTGKEWNKRTAGWCQQMTDGDSLSDEDLMQARGMVDWLGMALVRHPDAAPLRERAWDQGYEFHKRIPDDSRWTFTFHAAGELRAEAEGQEPDKHMLYMMVALEEMAEAERDPYWEREIEERLRWRYPHETATATAAKWSVSELKQRFREEDEYGAGASLIFERQQSTDAEQPSLPKTVSLSHKPRFLSEGKGARSFTKAEIGTIMHNVMQHLDLENADKPDGVQAQLERLVALRHLTSDQASQVNVRHIVCFVQSPLGQRVRNAVRVYREVPFTMAMSTTEILSDPSQAGEEQVIVQGVIDCMIEEEDGGIVLIDYKTDAIRGEVNELVMRELTDRYREQVRLYREAVQRIWRKPVKESYLYFFDRDLILSVE